jgi:GT2 family glycosyltransferase
LRTSSSIRRTQSPAPPRGLAPTLAAIIPASDAPPTLGRCVQAIRAAVDPPEELVVVEVADAPGPAAARNAGAARASADILVFVDADVLVHGDAFARIREAFAAQPDLAALFGSYDDEPEAPGVVSRFRNLLHHHVHQQAGGPATTFWAGLGAIRHAVFDEIGGFDAARFPRASVEDIELGVRLVGRGGRIVLDPGLRGRHLKRWTLPRMLHTDVTRRGVPWVALVLRSGTTSAALNLGVRHRLSALASVGLAAALARRRPRAAAGALVALLALNRGLYALVARRLGLRSVPAGVALHALHHLAGAVSLPLGLVSHLLDRRRTRKR